MWWCLPGTWYKGSIHTHTHTHTPPPLCHPLHVVPTRGGVPSVTKISEIVSRLPSCQSCRTLYSIAFTVMGSDSTYTLPAGVTAHSLL